MSGRHKIVFRADAGSDTGYGHFVRCLALADMLRHDFSCTFYTRTPTDYQLRETKSVCDIVSLPGDDSRFDLFLQQLQGDETVVLDNYFFTTDYQRAVKAKGCRLVCIDDMHDKHYVADMVINHGCTDASLFDTEPYTRLCLGMDYALLRRPFLQPVNTVQRISDTFVICFGGSDSKNLTYSYAKHLLLTHPTAHITAIAGDSYKYVDSLLSLGICVRRCLSAREMAELFCSTENVICSASTTCYEALACGATVYAGWYVENQKEIYRLLSSQQYIVPLDNLCEIKDIVPSAVLKPKHFPLSHKSLWCAFVRLHWRITDYRSTTKEESELIRQHRNAPSVRRWMRNSQPIPWDSHRAFMENLRTDDTKRYFAFFLGKTFVASYDWVNIRDTEAECGLYVNARYEGRGIASMVQKEMEKRAKETGIDLLRSEVMTDNESSLRFFTRNGFTETGRDKDYVYLQKKI